MGQTRLWSHQRKIIQTAKNHDQKSWYRSKKKENSIYIWSVLWSALVIDSRYKSLWWSRWVTILPMYHWINDGPIKIVSLYDTEALRSTYPQSHTILLWNISESSYSKDLMSVTKIAPSGNNILMDVRVLLFLAMFV